jgi:hypothetical protein
MEASKDHGGEPAGKDLGAILLLVAACPFGLLMWVALFSAIRWSVLAIWGVVVGLLPHPVSIATGPAIPALAPVTVVASQPTAPSPLWVATGSASRAP